MQEAAKLRLTTAQHLNEEKSRMEAREEGQKESHECSGHEAKHQEESLRDGHVLSGFPLSPEPGSSPSCSNPNPNYDKKVPHAIDPSSLLATSKQDNVYNRGISL